MSPGRLVRLPKKFPDVAVLVIDMAAQCRKEFRRADLEKPDNESTQEGISQILQLIREARRISAPVFVFMEPRLPPLPTISRAVHSYAPITVKYTFSPFGKLEEGTQALHESLQDLGARKVLVTGFNIEICAGTAMVDAYTLGYEVHSSPTVLFGSNQIPKEAVPTLLSWYREKGMIEPFDSLLARLHSQ